MTIVFSYLVHERKVDHIFVFIKVAIRVDIRHRQNAVVIIGKLDDLVVIVLEMFGSLCAVQHIPFIVKLGYRHSSFSMD